MLRLPENMFGKTLGRFRDCLKHFGSVSQTVEKALDSLKNGWMSFRFVEKLLKQL
jgi:hypothetical protein